MLIKPKKSQHIFPTKPSWPARWLLPILLATCLPFTAVADGNVSKNNLPDLGVSGRDDLPPLAERKLGEEIMRDIRRDRDYLDDAPLAEYLNNFGGQLLAIRPEARGEANFDFYFFAVRDPMINAFALPGGFIGVHSALILSAQSESELASVLAHEIGHVSQRHIARMLGQQKQDALIPLAAVLLAVLAAKSNPDASMGIMMGGEGLALQRQLNFSREAEREADRVGFSILQDAGFETSGMVGFFKRMQNASRNYSESTPAYLRSHPLTTERIADIDARNRETRYKQRVDSVDFHLIRARIRVLQDESSNGLMEAQTAFENQLLLNNKLQTAGARYGLALIAARQGDMVRAQKLLPQAYAATRLADSTALRKEGGEYNHPILANLSLDVALTANASKEGRLETLKMAQVVQQQFPTSRGLARQYATALLNAGRLEDASVFLRDQIQLYRQEAQLHEQLAQVYARMGKLALQHLSMAENYALNGSLPAAIEQLGLARQATDATFYDQALIDAKERELQARHREHLKELKGSKTASEPAR